MGHEEGTVHPSIISAWGEAPSFRNEPSYNLKDLKRVFVIPLFVNSADGVYCTVFAEVECE